MLGQSGGTLLSAECLYDVLETIQKFCRDNMKYIPERRQSRSALTIGRKKLIIAECSNASEAGKAWSARTSITIRRTALEKEKLDRPKRKQISMTRQSIPGFVQP